MKVLLALFLALGIAVGGFSTVGGSSDVAFAHERKVVRSTVVGGVVGAAIGGITSGSVGGVLIGGAIGATAGYVVGKHSYRCWRTNIFGYTYRGWCLR